MMRERLANSLLVILTICALTTTGLVVRKEVFAGRLARPTETIVKGWGELAQKGHWMGSNTAPVKIVVFSDFQCPYCATLARVLRSDSTRVAVVHRHYPLAMHSHARPAALASECAAEQGRFAEFHDALFAQQDSIGKLPWVHFARAAGIVSEADFVTCLSDTRAEAAIVRDSIAASRLKVQVTPTILINGLRVDGLPPPDQLEAYITRALRSADRAG